MDGAGSSASGSAARPKPWEVNKGASSSAGPGSGLPKPWEKPADPMTVVPESTATAPTSGAAGASPGSRPWERPSTALANPTGTASGLTSYGAGGYGSTVGGYGSTAGGYGATAGGYGVSGGLGSSAYGGGSYGLAGNSTYGGYGSTGYGSSYGSTGYGSSMYGSGGYGSTGYGSSMYGSGGYGSGGYGSSMYGSGGYGSSAYGSSMYGRPGMMGGGMYSPGAFGGPGGPMGPDGQPPMVPPNGWQVMLHGLSGIMHFFGRLSFLVDENTHAVHFFVSALLQLLDRAGTLYGEMARFILRILGFGRAAPKSGMELALPGQVGPHGAPLPPGHPGALPHATAGKMSDPSSSSLGSRALLAGFGALAAAVATPRLAKKATGAGGAKAAGAHVAAATLLPPSVAGTAWEGVWKG